MREAPVRLAALVLALGIAAAPAMAGCGHGSGDAGSTAAAADFAGTTLDPPQPAPPLALDDSLGRPLDLRDFRGKAILVTFVYTHCPDVCPLIVSHLHTALARLGPRAGQLQILAVSTDPRGDTTRAVAAFLRAHQMTGRMRYLIGGRRQLERTWRAWHVIAETDPKDPEFVEHSALVYGIDAGGRLRTTYPPNFDPAEVAHDVPLLARR